MGCPLKDANIIADVFVSAELRDLPSHGMIRLMDYFQLWKKGRINTSPRLRVVHETPSTAVVDADGAIGMIGATRSMELAIEKARRTGTGWVGTRNSNHLGIGSYYAGKALEHDMIGISMTNANPTVAPPHAVERLIGTNPVTMAVPADMEPPFIADFSTSAIARGKLAVASEKGEKIPFGYVQDKYGRPSDDPDIMKKGGAMVPLGSDLDHGSHKGFALAAMIDLLCGVLTGANFGPFVPPFLPYLPMPEQQAGHGMGHFFGALRVDAFMTVPEFKSRMDLWINVMRNAKAAAGKKVQIPGDIEREAEKRNSKSGIRILPGIEADLMEVAGQLGVTFEKSG